MKKIIVLYISQSPYWETARQAEYVSINHAKLTDWDDLKNSLPLAGLGVYSRWQMGQTKGVDPAKHPFVFLKITDMSFDGNDTYFQTKPLLVSNIPSRQFLTSIPYHNEFESREPNYIWKIFKGLQMNPPDEWLKLTQWVPPYKIT